MDKCCSPNILSPEINKTIEGKESAKDGLVVLELGSRDKYLGTDTKMHKDGCGY